MKSVRVTAGHKHFVVADIPEPEAAHGIAVIRTEAAFVAPYMAALPLGEWMTPPTPFTPGQCAVGIVEHAAGDLRTGQRVYFDAYVGSNDAADPNQDHGFIGCFAVAAGAQAALAAHPDGSFAEQIAAPPSHFTVLPPTIDLPPGTLCRLGWIGTALGGLVRGMFRPGMTLAVNGATGFVGVGAVLLAHAMGAGKIHILGRNTTVLNALRETDRDVISTGDISDTSQIDMLLECSGGDNTATTEALIARLRRYGTAVFIGALTAPLAVDAAALMRNGNTLTGSLWFTPDMMQQLIGLITSGTLDLSPLQATTFGLDDIQTAIETASTPSIGLGHVALAPQTR